MKVLIVFVDMIRPNRLSSFNHEIKTETTLDIMLKNIGGTSYTNCFTPGPDTPRGLATFSTGIDPHKNGCNVRLKWPRYFLNENTKSIFDLFLEKNYKLTLFANPNERETGMYPANISEMDIHNTDLNMKKYLSDIELEDNHMVFVGIPDFHWSFGDHGSTKSAEKIAYKDTKKTLDVVFDCLNKDDFDHIFIFSDHGFKFTHEFKTQPKYLLLDEDRTNILMHHRVKFQNLMHQNDKLCSLADMYSTIEEILGVKESKSSGVSLFSDQSRDYIIVEDHLSFIPSVNQNIELWAVVTKDKIYIRRLEGGYLWDRHNKSIVTGTIEKYDSILINESSFRGYFEEYKKIFVYRDILCEQTDFMHGGRRKKVTKFNRILNTLFDAINERIFNNH